MDVSRFGALCFGLVIGWVTYRTLRHSKKSGISDLAAVIAAVGGAAIVKLFPTEEEFAFYCIGLTAGFFLYLILFAFLREDAAVRVWMGAEKD